MRRLGGILLVLALAAGCHRPVMEETFVKVSQRDSLGRYGFIVDLGDSTLTYDVDLVVAMACNDVDFRSFRQMPLDVEWTAPSGQPYRERLWVQRRELTDSSYYNKYFWVEYRHDLRPVEPGSWQLALTVPEDVTESYGVTGAGVRLIRNGTR